MGFSIPNPIEGARHLVKKVTDTVKDLPNPLDVVTKPVEKVAGTIDHLVDYVHHPKLSRSKFQELTNLAHSRPDLAWPADKDIAKARNAHRTNTPEEMAAALRGNYDWLEGDVRLEGGLRSMPGLGGREAIMAHDVGSTDGLSFDEWVRIGKESGRGIKIDLKQAAALDDVIATLKRHGVPDERLIMNVGIGSGPGGAGGLAGAALNGAMDLTVSREDLETIRREFPNAIINLSTSTGPRPPGTAYSQADIDQYIAMAQVVGKPVMFPLRAEFVTPEVVEQLKPYGQIAIWNDPSTFNPEDVVAETRRFRQMGVDGMIDLMQKHG